MLRLVRVGACLSAYLENDSGDLSGDDNAMRARKEHRALAMHLGSERAEEEI